MRGRCEWDPSEDFEAHTCLPVLLPSLPAMTVQLRSPISATSLQRERRVRRARASSWAQVTDYPPRELLVLLVVPTALGRSVLVVASDVRLPLALEQARLRGA